MSLHLCHTLYYLSIISHPNFLHSVPILTNIRPLVTLYHPSSLCSLSHLLSLFLLTIPYQHQLHHSSLNQLLNYQTAPVLLVLPLSPMQQLALCILICFTIIQPQYFTSQLLTTALMIHLLNQQILSYSITKPSPSGLIILTYSIKKNPTYSTTNSSSI